MVSALSLGAVGDFDMAATYGVEDGQLRDTSGPWRRLSVSACSPLELQRANQSVPEPRSLAKFDSFSAPATIAGGDMMTMLIAVSHGRPGQQWLWRVSRQCGRRSSNGGWKFLTVTNFHYRSRGARDGGSGYPQTPGASGPGDKRLSGLTL